MTFLGWMSRAKIRLSRVRRRKHCSHLIDMDPLMNRIARAIALVAGLASTCSLHAEEPVSNFVNGLKSQGYFDTAMEYLAIIEQRQDIPAEVRAVVPYERAMLMVSESRSIRNTESRNDKLNIAEVELNKFISGNPDHPKFGQASTQLGTIQLERARGLIWEARSPANEAKKGEFQEKARADIVKAKDTFQKAHDRYEAEYKAFKVYIAPDEKELLAKRSAVEKAYMQAQLYLAQARYEEGQTYDAGSTERSEILTDASKQFETIHEKYRSIVAGLFARMWQGKCFEEQNEIGKALGIYNELLGHGGEKPSATLLNLQDRVLRFRLICLNHEAKRDFQLVITEGEGWLQRWRVKASTRTGLGIRWELAQGYESLSNQSGLDPAKATALRNSALNHASEIAKFPGEFADISNLMVQRLNLALTGSEVEPEDFMTAFMMSRNMVKQMSDMKEKVTLATTEEERKSAEEAFAQHASKLSGLLTTGAHLNMDDGKKPSIDNVEMMKHWRALLYYTNEQFYEASIAAFDVARRLRLANPQQAQDSGFLAVAASHQAFNRVPDGANGDPELELLRRSCDLIVANWPTSDEANKSRMLLGNIHQVLEEHVTAAEYYLQIPEGSEQYGSAQMYAGSEYLLAHDAGTELPRSDPNRPTSEELAEWIKKSEEHLDNGIPAFEAKLPPTQQDEELTFAKFYRALIYQRRGDHAKCIAEFEEGPHAIFLTVNVEEGQGREESGATSKDFAAEAYRIALYGYVGAQKIEDAKKVITLLDQLGVGVNQELFVDLGRQMEKSLDELKAKGDQEAVDGMSDSLEQFLDSIAERSDNLSFYSFLWLGEAYANIGKRLPKGSEKANKFLANASAKYQEILDRADKNPEYATEGNRTIIRLKQAEILALKDDFETAMTRVMEVLTERPKDLTAQLAASETLQAWGASNPAANAERFLQALTGKYGTPEGLVWGFASLSRKLNVKIAGSPPDADYIPEYEEKELTARLGTTTCRFEYAKALEQQGDQNKTNMQLQSAQKELELFAVAAPLGLEDEWKERFDSLYKDILRKRKAQTINGLTWPKKQEPVEEATIDSVVASKTGEQKTGKTDVTSESEEAGGSSTVLIIVGFVLAGAAAAGAFFMMKPQKRVHISYSEAAPRLPAAGASSARRKKKVARSAPDEAVTDAPKKTVKKKKVVQSSPQATDGESPVKKKKVVKKKRKVPTKRPPE